MTCTLIVDPELPSNTKDKAVVRRDGLLHTFLSRLSQSWPVTSVLTNYCTDACSQWFLVATGALAIEDPALPYVLTASPASCSEEAFVPYYPAGAGNPAASRPGCAGLPGLHQHRLLCVTRQGLSLVHLTLGRLGLYSRDTLSYLAKPLLNDWLVGVPSTMEETDSEEYHTHNDTESSLEIEQYGNHLRIKELTKVAFFETVGYPCRGLADSMVIRYDGSKLASWQIPSTLNLSIKS
ncbi:hypothetical protein Z043_113525 [Scleropages formosus]|uniref:Uncharacterized protein n=1 Tax=Scleropages formosus TaxID=113540 RepID=A0A0P7UHU3_SCLFO|nr:hypothetical protein Z043_113525 [Scleropages formosus]